MELWYDVLNSSDKKMMSRAEKVAVVTKQLNSYLVEIGAVERFNESQVNNKVDSAKVKGRELYKKYIKKTTGSSNDDNPQDDNVDLESAYQQWSNFRTYHKCFKDHPTWGVRSFKEIAVGEDTCVDRQPPSAPPAKRPMPDPVDDTEERQCMEEDLFANSTNTPESHGADCEPPLSPPSPTAVAACAGEKETHLQRSVAVKQPRRRSATQEGFLQEMKEINLELQRRQFEHEQKMQTQWAEYLDRRDEEKRKVDDERRREDIRVMTNLEEGQQRHAQQLQQSNAEFMARLMQKYNL